MFRQLSQQRSPLKNRLSRNAETLAEHAYLMHRISSDDLDTAGSFFRTLRVAEQMLGA